MKNRNRLFLLYFFTLFIGLGITVHATKADEAARGRVMTGINLRAAPGLAGKVITALEAGTIITITGEQSGWYQITYETDAYGYRGWVYGKYIEKFFTAPVEQTAITNAVEHRQPATVAPDQTSTSRAAPSPAAGEARTLPPGMPTNTIELIQAYKAPSAAATEPAGQILQPETDLEQPINVKTATDKTAGLQATGTDFSKEQPPTKAETVLKTAADPAGETTTGPGSGYLLNLVLKISSVFLSCLALMISYKTFHLVTAGGQRST